MFLRSISLSDPKLYLRNGISKPFNYSINTGRSGLWTDLNVRISDQAVIVNYRVTNFELWPEEYHQDDAVSVLTYIETDITWYLCAVMINCWKLIPPIICKMHFVVTGPERIPSGRCSFHIKQCQYDHIPPYTGSRVNTIRTMQFSLRHDMNITLDPPLVYSVEHHSSIWTVLNCDQRNTIRTMQFPLRLISIRIQPGTYVQ